MKKTCVLLFNIIIIFVALTTSLYAWYTNYYGIKNNDSIDLGSHANYYAAGSGTSDDPYIITHARHLYNLAWLQDLGYYDDKPYYFELKANIDMSDLTRNNVQSPIPSIGINAHPFISNFNGNGYVINNLLIDTDFNNSNYIKPNNTVLNQHTKDTINNNIIITNYVGMFGYVGSMDEINSNITEKIENFYLDNSIIKSNINCLVGIVAGYANSNIESVGVHYSSIKLSSGVSNISNIEKISKYTLIGDYNESILSWEDNSNGGGIGYGKSMDLEKIYNLVTTKNGSTKLNDKQVIPFKALDDEYTTAANDNMGFFVGGEINTYIRESTNMDKTTFYYPAGASNSVYTLPYKDSLGNIIYPAPSKNIYDATFGSDSANYYCLRLQGKLDVNNNLVTINDTYVNEEKISTLIIPRRCIWFKPRTVGNLEFVMVNPGDGENFTLTKIKRNIPGNYSSGMTIVNTLIETNYLGGLSKASSNINVDGKWTSIDYHDLAYFFSIEVTQEDIDNEYEYCLSRDNGSNGAYFWYLDIGSNGGNETNTKYGLLDNIDFVYSTEMGLSDITNKSLYSKVYFEISGTTTGLAEFYFKRNKDDLTNNIDIVLYYPDLNNNGLTLKESSTGNKAKAKDKNCEEI
ncbi:MAG: hypothetical protein ACI35S_01675 [Anaeroplasma sp.]